MAITKNTPEVKAAIVESVRNGAYAKHAAGAVGISEKTLYNWIDADEQFATAIAQARDASTNESIQIIRAADDWRARAWILERTRPEDFRESKAVEHAGSISLEGVLTGGLDEAAE